jgi:CHAT domain-containing protein
VERVISELPKSSWAHFATHGFFLDTARGRPDRADEANAAGLRLKFNATRDSVLRRNPFVLSGLVLAQANTFARSPYIAEEHADCGLLTAEAIAAVDCSQLELVVLSACESARGDQQVGDGVLGLQTAFHVAGARNVIASLWKVDDEVARGFASAFYRRLWSEGLPPLEALRHAQLELMRMDYQETSSRGPRLGATIRRNGDLQSGTRPVTHWAGFVLSGAGL